MQTLPFLGSVGSLARQASHSFLPPALSAFVVRQHEQRYTAVDHTVWRFILLQLKRRLASSAHGSYQRGLAASGIRTDRIPSIREMDRCLQAIGWRAVCVDGFLPPRVFQAFQARRVLPIARAMRSPEQLAYTPAPDIVHEAAGHAPILTDAAYSEFIQRIGTVASTAFNSGADQRLDTAVRRLSDLEQQRADTEPLRLAREELAAATRAAEKLSEAARVARLFWWTAEYGLVGTLKDYRLYGAGLLSSLGESHRCHRPEVRKIPLGLHCVDQGYDITREQPQLYVAADFDHLHQVLSELEGTLGYRLGGVAALRNAIDSGQLSTVEFESGLELVGIAASPTTPQECLSFSAGSGVCFGGQLVGRLPRETLVPLGHPERARNAPDRMRLRYPSGVTVRGRLACRPGSCPPWLMPLVDAEVRDARGRLLQHAAELPLLLGGLAITARAGASREEAAPAEPHGPKGESAQPAPPNQSCELVRLYERVLRVHGESCNAYCTALAQRVTRRCPDGWLLSWSLLERLPRRKELAFAHALLREHLDRLEARFGGRLPIASGLRFLEQRAGGVV